jgi:hypothetical protein
MKKLFEVYSNENEKNIDKSFNPSTKINENIYIGSLNSVDKTKLDELNITHIIIAGKNLRNNNHNGFNCLELLIDDSFEQDITKYIKIVNKVDYYY